MMSSSNKDIGKLTKSTRKQLSDHLITLESLQTWEWDQGNSFPETSFANLISATNLSKEK